MNTEHVTATIEAFCKHCRGEDNVISLPAACSMDVLRAFLLRHRRCEKPVEPSKQVELFDKLKAKDEACNCDLPMGTPHDCSKERQADNPISFIDEADLSADAVYVDPAALGIEPGTDYAAYAIDGSTDDPAPEIDPPSNPYEMFYARYPFAQDIPQLRGQLHDCLGEGRYEPLIAQPLPLPSTPDFQYIAAWARHECAHVDSERRGLDNPIGGLTIPARLPMPEALKKLLAPPKRKRGARPLASPKGRKTA